MSEAEVWDLALAQFLPNHFLSFVDVETADLIDFFVIDDEHRFVIGDINSPLVIPDVKVDRKDTLGPLHSYRTICLVLDCRFNGAQELNEVSIVDQVGMRIANAQNRILLQVCGDLGEYLIGVTAKFGGIGWTAPFDKLPVAIAQRLFS
ncbi:hypothetical protein [Rhizobium leguminosarum]|uniref:Uncharacterized protein n=1 Tax=Rhizobium leguminosarum bv. trifolii TaxID=386 RepID=A0A1C9HX83_RHILT|nr:hypothetical protein [Rhizobium leguminosarum]AOO91243.1 hypothetical protein [Rhizobium leguminosarum bv. trifolii]